MIERVVAGDEQGHPEMPRPRGSTPRQRSHGANRRVLVSRALEAATNANVAAQGS
jgi:hypothetical protein